MGFRLILGFDRAFVSKRHWSEKPRINAHGRITGVPYTTFDAGLPEKSRSCLKCPMSPLVRIFPLEYPRTLSPPPPALDRSGCTGASAALRNKGCENGVKAKRALS